MNNTVENKNPEVASIRTRFAPSPTGYLHIGGLRTALFSYLFARKNGGQFILRVEDTDQARFVEGAIEKLTAVLAEIGLDYDEGVAVENGQIIDKGGNGPYLQSRRKEIYQKYAKQLVDSGNAYYCFCDEKRLEELRKEQEALKKPTHYDRKCRALSKEAVQRNLDAGMAFVIRQAVPEDGQTVVRDLVYKEIVIDNKTLDDQILVKSDGFPTYHLAVVVDDHLMHVSHVIRGEEWIPSTPKHLLLYKAFGWQAPQFAHLPLILNKDRSKLSKRQGDVAVEDYLAKGYLKEALLNFVAFLGWNPKTEQEIFSKQQLVEEFDLTKINRAGAVFDLDKLDWINGTYIRSYPLGKLTELVVPYLEKAKWVEWNAAAKMFVAKNSKSVPRSYIEAVVAIERERLKKLSEIGERVNFYFDQPTYDPHILVWRKSTVSATKQNLAHVLQFLSSVGEDFFADKTKMEAELKGFIAGKGLDNGSVLWPLRVSLTGQEASPSPFEVMYVLNHGYGKYEISQRIERAIKNLE